MSNSQAPVIPSPTGENNHLHVLREYIDLMTNPRQDVTERIRSVLGSLTDTTEFPVAFFTHIDDGTSELLLVEDTIGLDSMSEGAVGPLSETYCRFTLARDEPVTVLEAGIDFPRSDPAYQVYGFESYVGTEVRVHGSVYGTLCLVDVEGHRGKLSQEDQLLIELIAIWLGHEVERVEKERYTSVLERVLRHNIRNSLTVIEGYASMLQDGDRSSREADVILEEAETLLKITEDARSLEQLITAPGTPETFDLATLLERLTRGYAYTHDSVTFDLDTPSSAPVEANPKLPLALMELIESAIAHNPSSEQRIGLTVTQKLQHVELCIEDDGPGIPPEEAQIIRGDHEITPLRHASGLGLWLVRKVVQQSNGDLSIDDCNEEGTEMTIKLHRPLE